MPHALDQRQDGLAEEVWQIGPGDVASGFAEMAAGALMNSRSQDTILDNQDHLRQWASEMSMLEDRQRRAIAAELHDRIGQNLVAAKINAGMLKKRDSNDEESDLVPAVDWLLQEFEQRYRLSCTDLLNGTAYDVTLEERPLPLEDEMRGLLFQATRELLANVVKHAQAHAVRVEVRTDERAVTILVEDDGVGFDPSKTGRTIGESGGGWTL